ncbi:hypothetical protein [Aurantibacter sp.]|uniref:hypothetical protein n=1 Tax=Aurantibacter sp. TaxID=2807103 RepID=UPI003266E1AC
MTGSLISLVSILIGIIAANVLGYFKNKYSFGFTGNTLVGVFGSILFIKTLGRLGFNAWAIINSNDYESILLAINLMVSALGGALGLVLVKKLYTKFNK